MFVCGYLLFYPPCRIVLQQYRSYIRILLPDTYSININRQTHVKLSVNQTQGFRIVLQLCLESKVLIETGLFKP